MELDTCLLGHAVSAALVSLGEDSEESVTSLSSFLQLSLFPCPVLRNESTTSASCSHSFPVEQCLPLGSLSLQK